MAMEEPGTRVVRDKPDGYRVSFVRPYAYYVAQDGIDEVVRTIASTAKDPERVL